MADRGHGRKAVSGGSIIAGCFLLVFVSTAHSASVILSWDRPDDKRVRGYLIYYGPAGSDFRSTPGKEIHSADQTRIQIKGLPEGDTYGFVAKSVDRMGNESVFSEVVFYRIPDADSGTAVAAEDGGEGSAAAERVGGGGGCLIQTVRPVRLFPGDQLFFHIKRRAPYDYLGQSCAAWRSSNF